MAAPPETGMEKAEMKQLLNKAAPDNPINCAFAQGKDQAVALLMMHKTKNPKACEKMLSEAFSDAKNARWGTAIVDPEDNASKVKFIINKAVSGMAKRLVKTLKGTGYNRVEIMLEDGTVVEGANEEERRVRQPPPRPRLRPVRRRSPPHPLTTSPICRKRSPR